MSPTLQVHHRTCPVCEAMCGRPGTRMAEAAQHAGVSVNDVTDELAVGAVSGVAAFGALPVTVKRAGDDAAR